MRVVDVDDGLHPLRRRRHCPGDRHGLHAAVDRSGLRADAWPTTGHTANSDPWLVSHNQVINVDEAERAGAELRQWPERARRPLMYAKQVADAALGRVEVSRLLGSDGARVPQLQHPQGRRPDRLVAGGDGQHQHSSDRDRGLRSERAVQRTRSSLPSTATPMRARPAATSRSASCSSRGPSTRSGFRMAAQRSSQTGRCRRARRSTPSERRIYDDNGVADPGDLRPVHRRRRLGNADLSQRPLRRDRAAGAPRSVAGRRAGLRRSGARVGDRRDVDGASERASPSTRTPS